MALMEIKAFGMAWYDEADFVELLKLFVDSEKLHRTYAEWRTAAEQGERQMTAQGMRVVRAYIRPKEFANWCKAEGLRPDAEARKRFANLAAFRSIKGSH